MNDDEAKQAREEEEQFLREIIRESAKRPLDQDERAALYFWTGVRDD